MTVLTDPRELRARRTRALGASLAGSSIEWYDYLLYGTVAPLVLVKRFFPASNVASGLLLAYATFAIPFFVRPFGGILFSHIGDRKGRKITLVSTLPTASIPLMGMLADRWGARRVFIAGTVALMMFAFPYFWLISRGSALWLGVATAVAMAVCWAPVTAVLGTLYAGMFSTEVRYTGVSLGYQLGAALAGGTAPLVATFLLERFAHSWLPVAPYLVAASALSLVTIATMTVPHE